MFIIAVLTLVGAFLANIIVSEKEDIKASRQRAIQECRDMGGEAILTYSNSSGFYITGCKLK